MSSKKETAISFLKLAGMGDVRKAFDKYVASNFLHHNPYFKGDAASLRQAMEQNRKDCPDKILDFQRALEDGDLVAVHLRVRLTPTDRDIALIHIFRFEGDKIAEVWEAAQQVPEHSPNENGVF